MKKFLIFVFALVGFTSQAQEFDFSCAPVVVSTTADGPIFSLSFEGDGDYTIYTSVGDFGDSGSSFLSINGDAIEHEEGVFSVAGYSGVVEILAIEGSVLHRFTIDLETGHIEFLENVVDDGSTALIFSQDLVVPNANQPYFDFYFDSDNTYILTTQGQVDDLDVEINGESVSFVDDEYIIFSFDVFNVKVTDGVETGYFQFDPDNDLPETLEGQLDALKTILDIEESGDNLFIYDNDDVLSMTITKYGDSWNIISHKYDYISQAFDDALNIVDLSFEDLSLLSVNETAYTSILVVVNDVLDF